MEYECPQDRKQLDVPNPYYGEVGGNTDQASASPGSEQNSPSHDQQTRKNTFPYVMEEKMASDSTTNQAAPHMMYQNMHGLCAAVDKASGKGATIAMTTHSEYDIVERCNTTSSTSPAVPRFKSSSDAPAYSLSSEPAEGEVYNVAYPVLTPKMENSVAVDGYECLRNVH